MQQLEFFLVVYFSSFWIWREPNLRYWTRQLVEILSMESVITNPTCLFPNAARAKVTLTRMGPAVWNGGFSTFLAFVLLVNTDSHIFTTFFKVWAPGRVFSVFKELDCSLNLKHVFVSYEHSYFSASLLLASSMDSHICPSCWAVSGRPKPVQKVPVGRAIPFRRNFHRRRRLLHPTRPLRHPFKRNSPYRHWPLTIPSSFPTFK